MNKDYADNWRIYLLKGIFVTLIGVVALVLPGPAFASLVILFGIFMVADGIFAIAFAVKLRKRGTNAGWILFLGIAGVIAGVLALLNPFAAAMLLIYFFACWMLLAGIAEVITAIGLRKEMSGEGWYILSGLLSVLFAVLLFAYPLAGAITITVLFGIYALISGVSMLSLSFRLKERHNKARGKGKYDGFIAIE